MADKHTKNTITRESIKKELEFRSGVDVRSACVMLVVISVIFMPLSVLPMYLILSMESTSFFPVTLCVLTFLLFLLPIGYWVYSLANNLVKRRLIQNDTFSIDMDTVAYTSEEPGYRFGYRYTVKVLYFQKYGKVVAGDVAYQMASNGDLFYLVILQTKKPTVVLHYPKMMYDLKNDLDEHAGST